MKIAVYMTGEDFEQDVGPLIRSFFPGAELDFGHPSDERSGADLGIFFFLKWDTEGDEGFVKIGTEYMENCSLQGDHEDVGAYIDSKADANDGFFLAEPAPERVHSEYRDHVLRVLYSVLEGVTGRKLPWGILTGVRPTKIFMEQMDAGNEDLEGYMKSRYFLSDEKIKLAGTVAANERRLLERAASFGNFDDTMSIYVGIPFCPSICNYCTFGSTPIGPNRELVEPYIEALVREIDRAAELFSGKKVTSVYFGGGTPTSIEPGQLAGLIERVCSRFGVDPGVTEFSVEAGRPDTITREHLRMIKDMGVNRISINPQTMSDETLRLIGRDHTADMVVNAFHLARECGHENINMDLIMGLSGETPEDVLHTLKEIEKLDPEGLTVHTLARKRASRLVTEKKRIESSGKAGMEQGQQVCDSEQGHHAFGMVQEMEQMALDHAERHGYVPYYLYRQKNMTDNLENVGFSKPGFECLYNILIMEEKQTILGLGAGASSKVIFGTERFRRVENVKNVREYINRIDEMIERKVAYVTERGRSRET